MMEKFVTIMFKSTTTCVSVNDLRRELFIKESKDLEAIPPSSASLHQHVLRASYVAGYLWHQSLLAEPVLPNIEEWGWRLNDSMPIPYWTALPEASAAIKELIKCSCNPAKGCKGNCKCIQTDLPCTELCKCNGDCERSQ